MRSVGCAVLVFFLTGCGGYHLSKPETEEPLYLKGQQCLREGKPGEALRHFLVLLDKRPNATVTNLEVGRLFLQIEGDPIECIHYLRRYQALCPNSKQEPLVTQLIDAAKREYIKQLPGNINAMSDGATPENTDLIRQLREENRLLRNRLMAHNGAAQQSKITSTVETKAMPARPGKCKTYKIAPGDTLSKISSKVYGTPNRWREIFEANKAALHAPNNLRVGTELQIP